MDQEKYIELYEKYLAGECSDTEKELLLKYLDGFELKEYSWEEAMGDREHIKEIIYSKLQGSTKQRATRRFNWARWSVAASLLIAVCFVGYKYRLFLTSKIPVKQKIAARINNDATPGSNKAILTLADGSKIVLDNTKKGLITNHDGVAVNQHNQGQLVYDMRKSNAVAEQASVINTISTPVGGQYQVILADGTKVWLNAASSLRFPTMFSGSERNVEVSGEVYFEVAKNAAKPFKVNFNGNTITVLGTHFNVMAYPEEAKSKVTLLEGSVKLSNTTGNAMLKPGMQALVKDANSAITTQKANIEAAVAWKNGYFLFDNENIQSIMRKISRWYDVDVAYQGEMTGKEFSGSISRFENVSEVLGMLELTGSIHFNLRERRIKVMP